MKKKENKRKKPEKKTEKKPERKGLREKILRRKKEPTEKKEKAKESKEKKPEKVKEKKEIKKASTEELLKDYEVIIHPLISEKAVNAIEAENQLTFVVNKKASKTDVRNAVESMFAVKVDSVRILRDMKGRKKAMVKINKEFKADEIATKLGVL
jgi:ribosomal protein uL23